MKKTLDPALHQTTANPAGLSLPFCIPENRYKEVKDREVKKDSQYPTHTQKNFRNACYQVGFCTEGISTGATPQDKYCKW